MTLKKVGRDLALVVCGGALVGATAYAAPQFEFEPVQALSGPLGLTDTKAKLHRAGFEDPPGSGSFVRTLVATLQVRDTETQAGEVWAATSLDDGDSWGLANVSETSRLWSIAVDHDGLLYTPARPSYGDSKGTILVGSGARVAVFWLDSYCPGEIQGTVRYPEHPGLGEQAFRCVWAARSADGGRSFEPGEPLSDGSRDAFRISAAASGSGIAVVWQEDPLGLQPGEGEGPGEGFGGARVSKGTDIWYTALPTGAFSAGAPFPEAVPVSDNQGTSQGASRPTLKLAGGRAVLVYEETRADPELELGKDVRFHSFLLTAPDSSMPGFRMNRTNGQGELENCRRARVIVQTDAAFRDADRDGDAADGDTAGVHVAAFWRQGTETRGGPADIILRRTRKDTGLRPGSSGFAPEDFEPGVVNLSSLDTGAQTGADPLDNSRAHRGFLRGDLLVFGYSRSPDQRRAAETGELDSDFFIRRSTSGGQDFEEPRNLSELANVEFEVDEPRIVATPGTLPSGDSSDIQDRGFFVVAFGTASKDGTDHDVYLTSSGDAGASFGPLQVLAGANILADHDDRAGDGVTQLRLSPDGRTLYAIWGRSSLDDLPAVVFRRGSARLAACEDADCDGIADRDDPFPERAHQDNPWLMFDWIASQLAIASETVRYDVPAPEFLGETFARRLRQRSSIIHKLERSRHHARRGDARRASHHLRKAAKRVERWIEPGQAKSRVTRSLSRIRLWLDALLQYPAPTT